MKERQKDKRGREKQGKVDEEASKRQKRKREAGKGR